jgi:hypothetical protein
MHRVDVLSAPARTADIAVVNERHRRTADFRYHGYEYLLYRRWGNQNSLIYNHQTSIAGKTLPTLSSAVFIAFAS